MLEYAIVRGIRVESSLIARGRAVSLRGINIHLDIPAGSYDTSTRMSAPLTEVNMRVLYVSRMRRR